MDIGFYRDDEELLRASQRDHLRRVRVYVPEVVQVVLGRGSDPWTELHVGACMEDGVPVLRRRGGGCAVLLDSGNVIVVVAEHAPGLRQNKAHLRRLSAWLLMGLERVGVAGLQQRGISDLVWGDRKVAGSCLHRSRDMLLYSASLLVRPDLSLMERYLRHPPREPDYRQGRSHREFAGELTPDLWSGSPVQLAQRLAKILV
jgi:lipoate-protein ligase A